MKGILIILLFSSCIAKKSIVGRTLILTERNVINNEGFVEYQNTWVDVNDNNSYRVTKLIDDDYSLGDTLGVSKPKCIELPFKDTGLIYRPLRSFFNRDDPLKMFIIL